MKESPAVPVRSRVRPGPLLLLLPALLITGACAALGEPQPQAPSPEEIPALEERLASDSTDTAAALRLGAAYRGADRLEDALVVLERTNERDPENPTAVLLLGLTYEDLERFDAARAAYEAYLNAAGSDAMRERIRDRIRLVERRQLLAEVRESLAREEQLAATEPEPRTVAVFPFRLAQGDPSMEPLSRVLADLLVTDLSQTDRLTVLERSRVQLLLDEMELSESGLVDPALAVRSGRLLGAARVVQGSMEGGDEQFALQAVVVPVGAGGRATPSLLSRGAADEFFDVEKRLALQIYEQMGIQLTPAERELVTQRPTENMDAIIAYGQGLLASDRGDFSEAADAFSRAASLDPSFGPAQERAEEAASAAAAAGTSTAELTVAASTDVEAMPGDAAAIDALVPTALGRDPAVEAFGQEGIGGGAVILEIIFPRQ